MNATTAAYIAGFLAVAREVEAFKLLNRSKRSVNTVRTVLRVWSDTGVLAPVTTDPERVR